MCLAAAQETAEDPNVGGQGPTVTFGGLVQTQLSTTSADSVDLTDLQLRRVRLGANAKINSFVSGRIQAELAGAAEGGSAELNEAYVLFSFAPPFQVLIGKGGRPFGIVDITSASRLIPIERGARFRGRRTVDHYRIMEELAYAGNAVGGQVIGEVPGLPFELTYAGGYFTGTAAEEAGSADVRQLAGRLQAKPLAWLTVGAALTSRVFAREDPVGQDTSAVAFGEASGFDPEGDTRRGQGYEVDLEIGSYGTPGFHLVGEFNAGTLNPFEDSRFTSGQVWAAYRFGGDGGLQQRTDSLLTGVEPLVRVSYGDTQGPLDRFDGVLVTPGLNLYAAENTRLALNLEFFLPEDESQDTAVAFRAQAQIAF